VFKAYLDEGGLQEPIFAIGGIVASEEEWAIFSLEWEAIIKPLGLAAYHSSNCDGGYEAFKGWPQDKRTALTIDLVSCMKERNVFMVGVSAKVEEIAEVTEKSGKALWAALYDACFSTAIGITVRQCALLMPEEEVSVVFDRQNEFAGTIRRCFNRMADDRTWPYADKLAGLAFGSRDKYLPLQAADKVAYETFKQTLNQLTDPDRPARMSLYELYDRPFYSGILGKDAFLNYLGEFAE
jgi:hypothetical protein